jgi:hypothetical protein
MSMSMTGQEILLNILTKIVVDVAIQKDDDYNEFMDAVLTSILYMTRTEQLWDDAEIQTAITIINQRAKELINSLDFEEDEQKPNIQEINNIINRAFENLN